MVKFSGYDLPYTGPEEGRQDFLDALINANSLPSDAWPLKCLDPECVVSTLNIAMPLDDYLCPACETKVVEW